MIVRGDNVIGYIYSGGIWTPYVCSRNIILNVSTEFIETSVRGTGAWATFKPTKNSFTGTIEGLVSLNVSGSLTLPELRTLQYSQSAILFRFQRTDSAGNVYTEEVTVYISNSTDTGAFDGVNTFSIELRGSGIPTIIYTPTTTNANKVKRYEYTAVGGELGFTDASLIGKDIVDAHKDGLGNSKIILSGTPVNKEMLYTSVSGSFAWAVQFEAGEEAYILYQDI